MGCGGSKDATNPKNTTEPTSTNNSAQKYTPNIEPLCGDDNTKKMSGKQITTEISATALHIQCLIDASIRSQHPEVIPVNTLPPTKEGVREALETDIGKLMDLVAQVKSLQLAAAGFASIGSPSIVNNPGEYPVYPSPTNRTWHISCLPTFPVPKIDVFVGGKAYFNALYEEFEALPSGSWVRIMGWMVTPDMLLSPLNSRATLIQQLKAMVKRGVEIRVLCWENKAEFVGIGPQTGAAAFFTLLQNECGMQAKIHYCSSDVIGGDISGTNHQKHVTVYNSKTKELASYIGGLDLAVGRYDDERKITRKSELPSTDQAEFDSHLYNGFLTTPLTQESWSKGSARMPFHDVQLRLTGSVAAHVAVVFDCFWTANGGDNFSLPRNHIHQVATIGTGSSSAPASPSASFLLGGARHVAQIYSSRKSMVIGKVGDSQAVMEIQEAMLRHIDRAKDFIYIEQQYFQGNYDDSKGRSDPMLTNEVPRRVAGKIKKEAVINGNKSFRVYIVMPMMPDRANLPADEPLFQIILNFQYKTRETMKAIIGPGWENHIGFFHLSQGGGHSGGPEFPIYTHSKLMIVDDEVVLIGSANVNDRSLQGDIDTEIAVSVYTPVAVASSGSKASTSGGEDSAVAKSLRKRLWTEHLGGWDPVFESPSSDECWAKIKGGCHRVKVMPDVKGVDYNDSWIPSFAQAKIPVAK